MISFTMNGIQWKIERVSPFHDTMYRSDGSRTVGATDFPTQTIYIDNTIDRDFFDKVLCHELVHCASFSYKCDIPIDTEEIIANFLSLYGREIIYTADDILKSLIS